MVMSTLDPYGNGSIIDFNDGTGDVLVERDPYLMTGLTPQTVHTVVPGDTLQSIANQYYGDSGYWMAIADINNIAFQFRDLEEGMQIIIP